MTVVVLWYNVLHLCYLCCRLAVSMFPLLVWLVAYSILDCSSHIPWLALHTFVTSVWTSQSLFAIWHCIQFGQLSLSFFLFVDAVIIAHLRTFSLHISISVHCVMSTMLYSYWKSLYSDNNKHYLYSADPWHITWLARHMVSSHIKFKSCKYKYLRTLQLCWNVPNPAISTQKFC